MTRKNNWSDDDKVRLKQAVAACTRADATIDWQAAGKAADRSPADARAQYFNLLRIERGEPRRRSKGMIKSSTRADRAAVAQAARDQIFELPPRSITSEFFGDPLPGRSALDRKRRGEVDPVHIDHRNAHLARKPSLPTRPWR